MKVYFEDNDDIYHLNYGNLITPQQARRQPNVQWPVEPAAPMEEEVTYTLFCISSDHPSREETWGHWVHWQHVNIQGCNLSTGHEINQYTGPEPSETSGVHRYVFLVFEENPHFPVRLNKSDDSDEMRMFTERRDFNTDNFIRHFNLGIPAWASNFFTSRFEQLPSSKQ
nr:PREDICTED: protein D2-like isoform X2 [Bemisia tabaci]